MSDPVVALFLNHYRKDINHFFPEADLSTLDDCFVWLTYRDLRPAGIFVFRQKPGDTNTTHIELDYAAPEYRDMKNAKMILERQVSRLNGRGTHLLTANSTVKAHQDYLRLMGFMSLSKSDEFQRVISAGSQKKAL